ncbi:MAG TPA: 3-deoxy-D-manno-octulosonic acid transferase [Stellaceae bacterium]|jgi:3-deoxy-D-manno-octulosonic-acid transferase|nr:3-deoxy-D-manno-octulosonic acid transferase [Stellaceae bacterium]
MSPLQVYRSLTIAAGPLTSIYLARRARRGKEDPARIDERRGRASRARPAGGLIWIHAASVGETASILALMDRLLDRYRASVLITTGTVTSARLIESRTNPRIIHQFVPLDHPRYVRDFLDHWRPDLALWVESELWPNLIHATRARHIPMLLLNARMSARSFRNWQRLPGVIRPLLAGFDLCLAQDQIHADRLAQLGGIRALCVGDLKAGAAPLPVAAAELHRLRQQIGARPVWLAASTHEGEEAIAADAHRALQRDLPAILTIVAPRHPSRADGIEATVRAKGLKVARRSKQHAIAGTTDIYLADTLGELGLFYRLAGIAFIGGSLVPVGGHNPHEAAQLDCAILRGPDMSNATRLARSLADADATETVHDAATLADSVRRLIRDPAERARRAAAAIAVAETGRVVLDAVIDQIAPWLERLAVNAEPVPA